jgi:hypothetical protein
MSYYIMWTIIIIIIIIIIKIKQNTLVVCVLSSLLTSCAMAVTNELFETDM